MLRRDAEAAGARRRDLDDAGREVDQLKALVSGLDATRSDLVASLRDANERARDAEAKLADAENETLAARGRARGGCLGGVARARDDGGAGRRQRPPGE